MVSRRDKRVQRSGRATSVGRRSCCEALKGPIPMSWLQSAARLPGRSLHTGLALWIASFRAKTRTVQLSNLDGMRLSCNRNQKYRALAWLEAAGLIEVRRQLGRSPVVTLLPDHRPPSPDAAAVKRSETESASGDGGQLHLARDRVEDGDVT